MTFYKEKKFEDLEKVFMLKIGFLCILLTVYSTQASLILSSNDIWPKIVGFCDFQTVKNLKLVDKYFSIVADLQVNLHIDELKKQFEAFYINPSDDITSNFFTHWLQSCDASITFNQPGEKDERKRFNPLSLPDQYTIKCMQHFILQIVDPKCLELSFDLQGVSSDFIAEKLGLKNYTLFYEQHCFQSFFGGTCIYRGTMEDFKCYTYKNYIFVIDPYFKVKAPFNIAGDVFYFFDYLDERIRLKHSCFENNNATPTHAFVPFKTLVEYIALEEGKPFIENGVLNPELLRDFDPEVQKANMAQIALLFNQSTVVATVIQRFIRTYNAQQKLLTLENLQQKAENNPLVILTNVKMVPAAEEPKIIPQVKTEEIGPKSPSEKIESTKDIKSTPQIEPTKSEKTTQKPVSRYRLKGLCFVVIGCSIFAFSAYLFHLYYLKK